MEEDPNNSIYIVARDEEFIESHNANELKRLPLDDLKGYYAMSDQLRFGKPLPRAFLLLEIVVQAFSNSDTRTQIFSGAGFNDKLPSSKYLRELLLSHELMHYSAEEREIELRKLEAAAYDSGDARLWNKHERFEGLLSAAHRGNNLWIRENHVNKISDRTGRVEIAATGIVVEYDIQSGDSNMEDKYLFKITIPTELRDIALGESVDTPSDIDVVAPIPEDPPSNP